MADQRKTVVALYVKRSSQEWIVLDADGNFWTVPIAEENAWEQRQPCYPSDDAELERVPMHYSQALGLPT